jgi:hypothetical protein
MDEMVALALSLPDDDARHATMMRGFGAIHLKRLRAHGCMLSESQILELLALDLELNAQGMGVWLNRRKR